MKHKRGVEQGSGEYSAATTNYDCEVWSETHGDPCFRSKLTSVPPFADEKALFGIGDRDILKHKSLGLICSVKCPGSIVIKTFDTIRELRDAGIVVAGGFHSPMERECLDFLLRGNQPIIIAMARRLAKMRLPSVWRAAVNSGRLLIISPFGKEVRRTSRASSHLRNEFIISHANAVLIPHASPGGQAETIARSVVEIGKPIFSFNDDENQNLQQLGARVFETGVLLNYTSE